MHAGARRYGLLELYDPVVSDWMSSGPEWHSGLVYGGFEGEEMIVGEDGGYEDIKASHMVAFTFNLKRPLAPQLKEVARQLEQGQFNYLAYGAGAPEKMGTEEAEKLAMHLVQSPKAHREKWPVYLRALDAHEAGASLSEIAEILPPRYGRRDQKAAHNVLEQARTLQFRF